MRNRTLVHRYADGLARALKDDREYGAVGAEIRAFLDLFQSRKDLAKAVVSPFVSARIREAVLGKVLAAQGMSPKASRFLKLLQDHKRLDLLPEIVQALPDAWADKQGVVSYEVASVVPLGAAQRDRLARSLEAAEGRPVRLVFKIDPALLGGLTVRKGHVIYDASVEGELAAIIERLGTAS
ncbi:MAG: ATP synthase F1 subunit delta [Acidobacteriota bacterium]